MKHKKIVPVTGFEPWTLHDCTFPPVFVLYYITANEIACTADLYASCYKTSIIQFLMGLPDVFFSLLSLQILQENSETRKIVFCHLKVSHLENIFQVFY